jgi:hypothetical protein
MRAGPETIRWMTERRGDEDRDEIAGEVVQEKRSRGDRHEDEVGRRPCLLVRQVRRLVQRIERLSLLPVQVRAHLKDDCVDLCPQVVTPGSFRCLPFVAEEPGRIVDAAAFKQLYGVVHGLAMPPPQHCAERAVRPSRTRFTQPSEASSSRRATHPSYSSSPSPPSALHQFTRLDSGGVRSSSGPAATSANDQPWARPR